MNFDKITLSKGEALLREYVSIKYHWVKPIYNYRPEWLLNSTGNSMELDVYLPALKVGFEFNGGFHLIIPEQKKRDKLKIEICDSLGVRLYVFSLQTLLMYVEHKKETSDKYEIWYQKLLKLLTDYRSRFKDDKSVSVQIIPTDNTKKITGIRTKKRGDYQRPLPAHHRKFKKGTFPARLNHKRQGIAQIRQTKP